jgi:hypothetical protein
MRWLSNLEWRIHLRKGAFFKIVVIDPLLGR